MPQRLFNVHNIMFASMLWVQCRNSQRNVHCLVKHGNCWIWWILFPDFPPAVLFFSSSLDSVENCGGRVLVHCVGGVSRSASVCIAYLMRSKRMSLREAYDYVKGKRSCIAPNINFMGQLLQYEGKLLAQRCTATPDVSCAVSFDSSPVSRQPSTACAAE